MTIAVIGTGNMGRTLAQGQKDSGKDVVTGATTLPRCGSPARTPAIVLAVPSGAVKDVVGPQEKTA